MKSRKKTAGFCLRLKKRRGCKKKRIRRRVAGDRQEKGGRTVIWQGNDKEKN